METICPCGSGCSSSPWSYSAPTVRKIHSRTVFLPTTQYIYSMPWYEECNVPLSISGCALSTLHPDSLPYSLHLEDIFHEWKYDKLFGSFKFYSTHIHCTAFTLYWDKGISQTKPFQWNKGLQHKLINGKRILRKSTKSLNCFMNM